MNVSFYIVHALVIIWPVKQELFNGLFVQKRQPKELSIYIDNE